MKKQFARIAEAKVLMPMKKQFTRITKSRVFIPTVIAIVLTVTAVTAVCVNAAKESRVPDDTVDIVTPEQLLVQKDETNGGDSSEKKNKTTDEHPSKQATPSTEPESDEPSEQPTEAQVEIYTEPQTETPTEAPTVAPTETPTETPTEAPTEAPTMPTEAPTEPKMNITVKARETMLDGTSVAFNVGDNRRFYSIDLANLDLYLISGQIVNAPVNEELNIGSQVFISAKQFQRFMADIYRDRIIFDIPECYSEDFFEENALIAILIPRNSGSLKHKINSIHKNGSELCIELAANTMNTIDGGLMGDTPIMCSFVEVKKDVLDNIDLICYYITSWDE